MRSLYHYLVMWLVFFILLTMAVMGLELIEGNKITTTEYYGLRNLGGMFILFVLLCSMALYPFTFLPLTLLIHHWVPLLFVRLLIYAGIGSIGGVWVFHFLYGPDGYFSEGYGLTITSSVILFSVAGLLYGLADHYFKKSGKNNIYDRNTGRFAE